VKVSQPKTKLNIILVKPPGVQAGIIVFAPGPLDKTKIVAQSRFSSKKEVTLECIIEVPGDYNLMACTVVPYAEDKFTGVYSLLVHSDKVIQSESSDQRGKCITEILNSERSYVNDLLLTINVRL